MRLHVLVCILLLAPLAGCAEAPEAELSAGTVAATDVEAPTLPGTTGAPVNLTSADAPAWAIGDAWTMGSDDGSFTLVVTQADGAGYTLSTDSETVAGFDAMFDISYVGRIRASDLAGSQGGTPVQFFSFPLEDGKKWSTTWDGLTIDLTATYSASIPTPAGAQPGFLIEGLNGETPYVHYDYVPALRWWSHIAFVEGYGVKVEKAARNWTGSYTEAVATAVFEGGTSAPVLAPAGGAFTVDEAQSFVMLALIGHAPMHARALVVTDPSGQPYMTQTGNVEASQEPMGYFTTERMPATPGEWHIASPILHHPEGGFLVRVYQIAIMSKALA